MSPRQGFISLAFVFSSLLTLSCLEISTSSDDGTPSTSQAIEDEFASFNNDASDLASRVTELNEVIPFIEAEASLAKSPKSASSGTYPPVITLGGNVAAPTVTDGSTTHMPGAASLSSFEGLDGITYFVAFYNTAGNDNAAGIQIISYDSTVPSITLEAEITLNYTDFVAGVVYPDTTTSTYNVVAFGLKNGIDSIVEFFSLDSSFAPVFAGPLFIEASSSVVVDGDQADSTSTTVTILSSSISGGVSELDYIAATLSSDFASIENGLAATYDESGNLYVLTGDPTTLVFNDSASATFSSVFSPGTSHDAEAKGDLDIYSDYVVISGGPSGAYVTRLSDFTFSLNIPAESDSGASSDTVTNAIDTDDHTLFMANGASVGAAYFDMDITSATAADPDATVEAWGTLDTDAFESANDVIYQDGLLFVAAGLGGVYIATVEPSGP